MATSTTTGPSKLENELDGLSTGLLASSNALLNSLVILGVSTSKAAILSKLKSYLQLLTTVDQAKQAYLAALLARNAAAAEIHSFVAALIMVLKQTLGPANQSQLAAFGILPPKQRKPVSSETMALSRAKAAATRKARGTIGKTQKLAIPAVTNLSLQILGPDGSPVDGSTATVSSMPVTTTAEPTSPVSTPTSPTSTSHT